MCVINRLELSTKTQKTSFAYCIGDRKRQPPYGNAPAQGTSRTGSVHEGRPVICPTRA